jgi:hypothetical protein
LGVDAFGYCKNLSEIRCLFEKEPTVVKDASKYSLKDAFKYGPEERTVYFVSNDFDEKKYGGTKKVIIT